MADRPPTQLLEEARESLAHRRSFEELLAALAPKDKINAQKRIEVLEAEADPSRVQLWKRLTAALMTLAPIPVKFSGRQMIQFYVADGKYRMQVFALEDLQDGRFTIYCPNVMQEAISAGLLLGDEESEPNLHRLGDGSLLCIEPLDKDSLDSAPHFKDMIGWNRRALRIVLPAAPSPAQVEASELLCGMAARHFLVAPPSTSL